MTEDNEKAGTLSSESDSIRREQYEESLVELATARTSLALAVEERERLRELNGTLAGIAKRLREAERILRLVAECPPIDRKYAFGSCAYCLAENYMEVADHEPGCPWRVAKVWVSEPGADD